MKPSLRATAHMLVEALSQAPWEDRYVGIPFESRGRTEAGLDCWGLMMLVYRDRAGIELPNFEVDAYDVRAVDRIVRGEEASGEWLPVLKGAERELDAVVFRSIHETGHAGEFHVGLVASRGRILHCEEVGVVCLDPEHPSIEGRIKRVWRHRRLA